MIKYLPLLLILISAAPYKPYVDEFQSLWGRKVTNQISIVDNFRDSSIGTRAIGVCYYEDNSVELLKSYWDSASSTSRRALIFHELGHCALNRGHFDIMEGKFPLSIMRWQLIQDWQYSTCQAEYDKELFYREYKDLLQCIKNYYFNRKGDEVESPQRILEQWSY